MKNRISAVFIGLLLFSCAQKTVKEERLEPTIELNEELLVELQRMVEVDQIAAYIPQGKYVEYSKEEWRSFKDSVFTIHQKRLEEIFKEYGFLGFDLVGEQGSSNFWLMVQHSDHNPDFQKQVLEKMKIEVDEGNAKASNYGFLVDRVRLNLGGKQLYGTQVEFNVETAEVFPKSLEDSLHVNERRASIGLQPIEEYLNQMLEMHFEMNKERYLAIGISEPQFYEIVE